jgi:trehalose 6-phosphate synthase
VKLALLTALEMPDAEAQNRMRKLRRQVLSHDVDRWARSFLDALGLPPAESDERDADE